MLFLIIFIQSLLNFVNSIEFVFEYKMNIKIFKQI